MYKEKECLIGRDDDGAMIAIAIGIAVVAVVLAIIFYGGMFIGGFYSLKNYFTSFKENVIDSNRTVQAA